MQLLLKQSYISLSFFFEVPHATSNFLTMAISYNAIRPLYTAAVANNNIHHVSRHHYEGVDGLGLHSKPVIMVIHHAPSRPIFGG